MHVQLLQNSLIVMRMYPMTLRTSLGISVLSPCNHMYQTCLCSHARTLQAQPWGQKHSSDEQSHSCRSSVVLRPICFTYRCWLHGFASDSQVPRVSSSIHVRLGHSKRLLRDGHSSG